MDDISKLSNEYLKFKEPEADKTKIKQDLKAGVQLAGVQLAGVQLVEKQNIQIK